jgi:hypothetical protein
MGMNGRIPLWVIFDRIEPFEPFRSTAINGHYQIGPAGPVRAIIGLVQRSKHDPLPDHLIGAGAKAPPRVASAK